MHTSYCLFIYLFFLVWVDYVIYVRESVIDLLLLHVLCI